MRTLGGGESSEVCAVELDAISLRRSVTVLGSREVYPPACFIHAFQNACFPRAAGHLVQKLTVRCVMINMFPAAALAEPKERAVFEPRGVVDHFDPGFRSLVNQCG